jgi:hypothetical protein
MDSIYVNNECLHLHVYDSGILLPNLFHMIRDKTGPI